MKKFKAYTLLEMLVVMTIMIILLGVGFGAYTSFTETTKFNEDVSNLQSDILIIQRASMLLERDPNENWVYGLGIDLGSVNEGSYDFFKWCSEFTHFGSPETRAQYPAYVEGESDGILPVPTGSYPDQSECPYGAADDSLLLLSGYSGGVMNLKGSIEISDSVRFILFESVSGRVFFYDGFGNRIDGSDLNITFRKNYGPDKTLEIKTLTGRTKIIEAIN
jgi:type II secretory pathway pseudopilin PulG